MLGGKPGCGHLWEPQRSYKDSPARNGGEGVGFQPIAVVTNNGSAYGSEAFARYIGSRPNFTHVRPATTRPRPMA